MSCHVSYKINCRDFLANYIHTAVKTVYRNIQYSPSASSARLIQPLKPFLCYSGLQVDVFWVVTLCSVVAG
jgi:hypothetical protein